MKLNSVFMMLAVSALVLAVINASMVVIKTPSIQKLTGYASGYVNVTINTAITINMTTDTVNWGQGTLDAGQVNATLYTNNGNTAVVSRGNWSTTPTALAVANIGNVNASLTLQTGKTALTFLGGTTPIYQWNVTNKEASSCGGNPEPLNRWANVNQSAAGKFCNQFGYLTAANEVYINLLLTVPLDATAATSTRTDDTITVIAATAS